MADPGHRIKSVCKHFYKLASATVGMSRVNKLMAKRLKKNWGYMIRQSKMLSIVKFIENAKAPLEHMFVFKDSSRVLRLDISAGANVCV